MSCAPAAWAALGGAGGGEVALTGSGALRRPLGAGTFMLLVMGHTGGSKRHTRDPQAGNAGEGGTQSVEASGPGLSCSSAACARDPASPALPRAATSTIGHPLSIPASVSLLCLLRPLHSPLPTWPEFSHCPQGLPRIHRDEPFFPGTGTRVCQAVAATARTPRVGRRAPSPSADGMPQAQRPAAPRWRPRGRAEAEGSGAHWPGPQPWAPAPRAPPPPSCRGLIQACGKRTWLAGTERPPVPLGRLDAADAALGPCLGRV